MLRRPSTAAGRRRRLDPEVIPDRPPEAVEVGHRPAPELVVAVMIVTSKSSPRSREPAHERDDVGALDPLRARSPQQVAFPHALIDSHLRSPPSGTLRLLCHGTWCLASPGQVCDRVRLDLNVKARTSIHYGSPQPGDPRRAVSRGSTERITNFPGLVVREPATVVAVDGVDAACIILDAGDASSKVEPFDLSRVADAAERYIAARTSPLARRISRTLTADTVRNGPGAMASTLILPDARGRARPGGSG